MKLGLDCPRKLSSYISVRTKYADEEEYIGDTETIIESTTPEFCRTLKLVYYCGIYDRQTVTFEVYDGDASGNGYLFCSIELLVFDLIRLTIFPLQREHDFLGYLKIQCNLSLHTEVVSLVSV